MKAADFADKAAGIIHATGRSYPVRRKYGPLAPAPRGLILRRDTSADASMESPPVRTT
jgi:hypothetical protein